MDETKTLLQFPATAAAVAALRHPELLETRPPRSPDEGATVVATPAWHAAEALAAGGYPLPGLDLRDFLRTMVSRPDQWLGALTAKDGLFFTPHQVWGQHRARYAGPRLGRFDGPMVEGVPMEKFDTLFVETDEISIEEQIARLTRTEGLPAPNAMVLSGDPRLGLCGRSVHAFWRLASPVSLAEWRAVQTGLLGLMEGDGCSLSPWQPMRVGGFVSQTRSQTLLTLETTPTTLAAMQAAVEQFHEHGTELARKKSTSI